jgi:rod shape-determining protein MreB and related proteins
MKFSLRQKIALDLGTANTLVYLAGKGVILNEPTVVAYSLRNKSILAVGSEARDMLGRTPGTIIAARPLKEGVIADYSITEAMISYFIKKAIQGIAFRVDLMISIPGGSTQVEKRAVVSACKSAGATDVYLMEEPLAAAIGAKIPISQPSGHMIINIGGGTAEIAVISLGQLVVYKSVRTGGTKLDEVIAAHIRKEYSLVIGDRSAEDVKMRIGNADKESAQQDVTLEVKGRDFQTGLPRIIHISELEICEALQKPLKVILDGVKEVLSLTPPELSSDIVDRGIVISGGTGLLRGIDRFFTYHLGVPCFIAEDPLLCVIKGVGMAIENLESYKEAIR